MRVVAYSIKSFEKELLAKANQKKHDITLISNRLTLETSIYAKGKDAVVVFTNDDLSAPVIDKLAELGIKYIATRSVGTDHIDKDAAAKHDIKIANVPSYSPQAIAEYTVSLALALSRKLIPTVDQSRNFDFSIDQHMGFNFYGKTVGLIGLGHIGLATAEIFSGLGCHVLGYDVSYPENMGKIEPVELDTLLSVSDIISLHVPLNDATHHLINKTTISQMKKGVMLLNTSRGGLLKTDDVLTALENGRIGYLGLDVYEFEKNLFFYDHHNDTTKDKILERLMALKNVIITPHQAFLTREALHEIEAQTILNLDRWQENQCAGEACACVKKCYLVSNEVVKVY
ncbi:2-hydroxyacid dehydrogenase [Rubrolithibacter danxiaensis]|uniref:2-hydroxyacid dehydrogenase n=1 Tax=Rubrolithibacter danxiaensis TaxID=3390805 RepID=UPI003BF87A46